MSRSQAGSEKLGGAGHGEAVLRRVSRLILGAFGLFSLLAACALGGLRLNLSASMPVGLYVTASGPPVRGSIVLACLPEQVAELAMARGYVPRGGSCPGGAMPVGKTVLAVAGDTIVVTPIGLVANGMAVPNSEALLSDRNGKPLPRMPTSQWVVAQGEFWLHSDHSPRSFDSRYFGPVNARGVRAHVRSLWTIRSPQ